MCSMSRFLNAFASLAANTYDSRDMQSLGGPTNLKSCTSGFTVRGHVVTIPVQPEAGTVCAAPADCDDHSCRGYSGEPGGRA